MLLRGLLHLTWLETKIFVREPLGVVGSVAVPVVIFVMLSRLAGGRAGSDAADMPRVVSTDLPIFVAMLIAASAVLSLVTIVSIYREGGILKRLRATPLRPYTILAAHVLVKLLFTAVTLALMMLAGRRYYPDATAPVWTFTLALLFTTVTLTSLGFVIASVVPTARFAQPIGAIVVYPMLAMCGLFVPVEALPPTAQAVARFLPFTYAVSLLRGVWHGEGWAPHIGDVGALLLMFVAFTAVSTKVFRWE